MKSWNKIRKLYQVTEIKNEFGYQMDELIEAEIQLKITIPRVLKDYYCSLGKNKQINASHNRLLKPTKEVLFSDDRYLVFYEENQASVYWGIKEKDLKLENPPVWGNYGTTELADWHLETKTTEDFLLLMAIYNGTLGGLKYHANCFDDINHDLVKNIQKNWQEIEEISWNKQRIYTIDFDVIISLSFEENGNCIGLFVGTNYQEQFDKLLKTLIINWSYTSYEDEE